MSQERRHLLAQAALCFEQAGQPGAAARCRDKAGELAAAAELYQLAGELTKAADCWQRAGRTDAAASCLLALGRPQDAAQLWVDAGDRLEAAWILAMDAAQPQRAHRLLAGLTAAGPGEQQRLRIARTLCMALERQPDQLVTVLDRVGDELADVTPASEQARVAQWAVQAAGMLRRPDLAARIFAAAYLCRVPGTLSRWRTWAAGALGGTAGIPEREL